jgi:hypothetical protein
MAPEHTPVQALRDTQPPSRTFESLRERLLAGLPVTERHLSSTV